MQCKIMQVFQEYNTPYLGTIGTKINEETYRDKEGKSHIWYEVKLHDGVTMFFRPSQIAFISSSISNE